ncbi:MAG: type II toxin-antitoxin system VapC family toxin [Terracidiphilus sp.]|jgi:predicted nucleic acid-binding protein
MSLVLDASATLAWLLPEELTGAITAAFDLIADDCAWVPSLWRIEVANSLSVKLLRGRITPQRRREFLDDLKLLPIYCDQETNDHVWGKTLELADRHNLTVYDATYLELALRLSLPLAALDDDLRKAAQREGVPLLGK